MKIEEIKEILKNTEEAALAEKLEEFQKDERQGVQKLILQYEKKVEKYKEELKRIEIGRAHV